MANDSKKNRKKENDDLKDFTTGSITNKLVRFMFPILGALILQAMYSAVDLLIVGQFGSTAGQSGVSTGSSIMNMVTFTICSLTVGVTVIMGQYIGEGRAHKIGKLIGGAVCFFTAVGLVVAVLLAIFAHPLAEVMQSPKEALETTTNYIRICGIGFVFIVFFNFLSSIFRGLGDSKMPLIFVLIACIVNVFGDLLFVAVFKMDERGAALATVLAQAVSVILSLFLIKHRGLPFEIKKADFRFNSEIGRFFKVGFPLALQDLLTNLTFLAICAFINRISLEASAGYGIAQRIQSFVMLIPSSIMQSMAAFVAQNVGARQEARAKKAMKTGMLIGAGIGVFIAYLAFFHGDMLAAAFTPKEAVMLKAFEYLRGFAPEAVVTSILFSYMGYFNGHSKSTFVMAQGLMQSFLVRLPMSWYMSVYHNSSLTFIGLAAPTATTFGIILCTIYYVYLNRKRKNESA